MKWSQHNFCSFCIIFWSTRAMRSFCISVVWNQKLCNSYWIDYLAICLYVFSNSELLPTVLFVFAFVVWISLGTTACLLFSCFSYLGLLLQRTDCRNWLSLGLWNFLHDSLLHVRVCFQQHYTSGVSGFAFSSTMLWDSKKRGIRPGITSGCWTWSRRGFR
jgi:hypothetical protein